MVRGTEYDLAMASSQICFSDLFSHSVVVLGDGDFSFAAALARLERRPAHLCATALKARPDAADAARCDALAATQQCSVHHGVDATQLASWPPAAAETETDRVVFNFPHAGRKIQLNRALLVGFFAAAAARLRGSSTSRDSNAADAEVWVTLCAGQGGTPFELTALAKEASEETGGGESGSSSSSRGPLNSWDVVDAGARAGLVLRRCAPPDLAPLLELGYAPGGYRDQSSYKGTVIPPRFWKNARTHIFGFPARDRAMVWAPIHCKDVAFWHVHNESSADSLAHFRRVLAAEVGAAVGSSASVVVDDPSAALLAPKVGDPAAAAGGGCSSVSVIVEDSIEIIDEYLDVKNGRCSRTLRVGLRSSTSACVALDRRTANAIADAVRAQMDRDFSLSLAEEAARDVITRSVEEV